MKVSRFENVMNIAGAEFSFDPWGGAIGMFFDVVQVIDMADVEGNLTPKLFEAWQYRRGLFVSVLDIETVAALAQDYHEGEFSGDYSYGVVALAYAIHTGDLTVDDLIYAGNVLARYTSLLDKAGLSY